jgi:hypothetical protein
LFLRYVLEITPYLPQPWVFQGCSSGLGADCLKTHFNDGSILTPTNHRSLGSILHQSPPLSASLFYPSSRAPRVLKHSRKTKENINRKKEKNPIPLPREKLDTIYLLCVCKYV